MSFPQVINVTLSQQGPPGPGLQPGVIATSGTVAAIWTSYFVRTSLGPLGVTLPALASVPVGSYAEFVDGEYAAAAHNITIEAVGDDLISDHGTLGADYVIQWSNTITRIYAGVASWVAITYGS